MYSLAAYPDSLGGPWQPLGGLAYTLPALTALAGFWQPAASARSQPWHKRNNLKVIVRGLTHWLHAYATNGIAPLTANPRAA
jgi:hypothetical protein